MPPYLDLFNLSEDKRIDLIGHRVMEHHETVGFIVDLENGDHTKGDRYIQKLTNKFPAITVMWRKDGPVADVETIKVGIIQ